MRSCGAVRCDVWIGLVLGEIVQEELALNDGVYSTRFLFRVNPRVPTGLPRRRPRLSGRPRRTLRPTRRCRAGERLRRRNWRIENSGRFPCAP